MNSDYVVSKTAFRMPWELKFFLSDSSIRQYICFILYKLDLKKKIIAGAPVVNIFAVVHLIIK